MSQTEKLKKLSFVLLCLILAAVLVYSGFRFLEATVFTDTDEAEGNRVSKTIEVDGVRYFPKQDMETLLVIGVDREGPAAEQEYYAQDEAQWEDAYVDTAYDTAAEDDSAFRRPEEDTEDQPRAGRRSRRFRGQDT